MATGLFSNISVERTGKKCLVPESDVAKLMVCLIDPYSISTPFPLFFQSCFPFSKSFICFICFIVLPALCHKMLWFGYPSRRSSRLQKRFKSLKAKRRYGLYCSHSIQSWCVPGVGLTIHYILFPLFVQSEGSRSNLTWKIFSYSSWQKIYLSWRRRCILRWCVERLSGHWT